MTYIVPWLVLAGTHGQSRPIQEREGVGLGPRVSNNNNNNNNNTDVVFQGEILVGSRGKKLA
jgi:hypothetical protein